MINKGVEGNDVVKEERKVEKGDGRRRAGAAHYESS
jgi:hypothetical protein